LTANLNLFNLTAVKPVALFCFVLNRSASLCLFALTAIACAAQTISPAERLLNNPRPLVIAHRGYSAIAPENTAPAFERALASGADLIELDYHHSKDGALVVLHDNTLDRTTDATNRWGGGRLKVSDHTLAQLRELQAGLWFKPPHPHVALPTLSESLDIIQRGSVTLIERKAGDAAACVKLLSERGLVNQVVVQAFDWDYLRDLHGLEPRQVLGALGPPSTRNGRKLEEAEKPLGVAWLDEVKSIGARAAVWNKQVDAAAVKAAHQRGLKVWVYTINDEATARQLLSAGVDGIITDNPSIVWKALATR
jgi:glycerophosphoryl diester phosphodiesterase